MKQRPGNRDVNSTATTQTQGDHATKNAPRTRGPAGDDATTTPGIAAVVNANKLARKSSETEASARRKAYHQVSHSGATSTHVSTSDGAHVQSGFAHGVESKLCRIAENDASLVELALDPHLYKHGATVNLSHSGFNDRHAAKLANTIRRHTSVRGLNLSETCMTDEGFKQLCRALSSYMPLTYLRLGKMGIGIKGFCALGKMLAKNNTLLGLFFLNQSVNEEQFDCLLDGLQRNRSIRRLGLAGMGLDDRAVIRLCKVLTEREYAGVDLLGLKRNPGITYAGLRCIAEFAVKFNCSVEVDNEAEFTRLRLSVADTKKLHSHKGSVPDLQPKLIMCGHAYAGKTTLVSSLSFSLDSSHARDVTSVYDVVPASPFERTLSVNVRTISLSLSQLETWSVYDFAGQEQFIAPHSPFIEGDGVFVIMASLHKPPKERVESVLFWIKFIVARYSLEGCPKVHIVLSNRDLSNIDSNDARQESDGSWRSAWGDKTLHDLQHDFDKRVVFDDHVYVLDCLNQDDPELARLRAALQQSRKVVLQTSVEVPTLGAEFAAILPILRQRHERWPIVEREVFWEDAASRCNLVCPEKQRMPLLRWLQKYGQIILTPATQQVVLTPSFVCQSIFGPVFAPSFFPNSMDKDTQGQVLLKRIGAQFPGMPAGSIIHLLQEFELCFKTNDYLVLPSLITIKIPKACRWNPAPSDKALGRRFVCASKADSFSPALFSKLQVRIAMSFERARVQLWKDGLELVVGKVVLHALLHDDGLVQSLSFAAYAPTTEDVGLLDRVEQFGKLVQALMVDMCPGTNCDEVALSPKMLLALSSGDATTAVECARRAITQASGYSLPSLTSETEHRIMRPTHRPCLHPDFADLAEDLVDIAGWDSRSKPSFWPLAGARAAEDISLLVLRSNSNLDKSLHTDREDKSIQNAIHDIEFMGPRVYCHSKGDVTAADIETYIKRFTPDCVHFCGHGGNDFITVSGDDTSGDDDRDDHNEPTRDLKVGELADILARCERQTGHRVVCFVFNSCNGASVSKALQEGSVVDVGIGPKDTVDDNEATRFATTFWRATFLGKPLEDCLREGISQAGGCEYTSAGTGGSTSQLAGTNQ